mmetsp:Transcript_65944/g.110036  ORF Transcript_65944/g.110036 Transcript_65944/m.110036 type:complete len:206 (+) Transcript_65944:262-879(+)
MVSLRAHVKPIVVGPGVLQLLPLVTILRRESVADIRRFKDDTLIGHSFDVTGPFNLAVQLHQLRYRSVHIACEPHPCQLRSRIHVRQAPWVRFVRLLDPRLPVGLHLVGHQSPLVVHPLKANGVLRVVENSHQDRRVAVLGHRPGVHGLRQRHGGVYLIHRRLWFPWELFSRGILRNGRAAVSSNSGTVLVQNHERGDSRHLEFV